MGHVIGHSSKGENLGNGEPLDCPLMHIVLLLPLTWQGTSVTEGTNDSTWDELILPACQAGQILSIYRPCGAAPFLRLPCWYAFIRYF